MHFTHPALLYALFLLLIPLIVHLFQLRKFQKEDFTNVKFLKKISQQTRKSSRLKKWLVLITRILALAAIILAFCQPYLPASQKLTGKTERLIYLDNSQSMQLNGKHGKLLPAAIQNLLENLPDDENISLITNDNEFYAAEGPELKKELQELEYSSGQINFRNLQLKATNFFRNKDSQKEVVLISDFQQNLKLPPRIDSSDIHYNLIPLKPETSFNISIDTAFISESTPENIMLEVVIKSTQKTDSPVPVSLFDENKLLAKNTADLSEKNKTTLSFRIENSEIRKGRLEIEDNGLSYDNILYFSINKNPAIKVAVISGTKSGFLERIYTQPEFELNVFDEGQPDYNILNSANLIVLNEVPAIDAGLRQNLKSFYSNRSSLIIIPPAEDNSQSYTKLLSTLNAPILRDNTKEEHLITHISFSHPLFHSVFEGEVKNFDYPRVQSYYRTSGNGNNILSYQDNSPFLLQQGSLYLFTAALNENNSNFKQSPLIVPVFYNIGINSLKNPRIYYQTGETAFIDLPVSIGKDEVLSMLGEESNFIPQQQVFAEKVQINTEQITEAGNFELMRGKRAIKAISFNQDRTESNLVYPKISPFKNAKIYNSIKDYFESVKAASQNKPLWKWFVIFALFFLILEMLLLKYFK